MGKHSSKLGVMLVNNNLRLYIKTNKQTEQKTNHNFLDHTAKQKVVLQNLLIFEILCFSWLFDDPFFSHHLSLPYSDSFCRLGPLHKGQQQPQETPVTRILWDRIPIYFNESWKAFSSL